MMGDINSTLAGSNASLPIRPKHSGGQPLVPEIRNAETAYEDGQSQPGSASIHHYTFTCQNVNGNGHAASEHCQEQRLDNDQAAQDTRAEQMKKFDRMIAAAQVASANDPSVPSYFGLSQGTKAPTPVSEATQAPKSVVELPTLIRTIGTDSNVQQTDTLEHVSVNELKQLATEPHHFLEDLSLLGRLLQDNALLHDDGNNGQRGLKLARVRLDLLRRLKVLPHDNIVRITSERYPCPSPYISAAAPITSSDETFEQHVINDAINCCRSYLDSVGLAMISDCVAKHQSYEVDCLLAKVLKERNGPSYDNEPGLPVSVLASPKVIYDKIKDNLFHAESLRYWQADLEEVPASLPLTHRAKATRNGHSYFAVISYYLGTLSEQAPGHGFTENSAGEDIRCQPYPSVQNKKREREFEAFFVDRQRHLAINDHHRNKKAKVPEFSTSAQQRDYAIQLQCLQERNKARLKLQAILEKDQSALHPTRNSKVDEVDKTQLVMELRHSLQDHYNKYCVFLDRSLSQFKTRNDVPLEQDLSEALYFNFRRDISPIENWSEKRTDFIICLYGSIRSMDYNPRLSRRHAQLQDYDRQLRLLKLQNELKGERSDEPTVQKPSASRWTSNPTLEYLRSIQVALTSFETRFKRSDLMPAAWPDSCEPWNLLHADKDLNDHQNTIERWAMWKELQTGVLRCWIADQAAHPWPLWSFGPYQCFNVQEELELTIVERQRLAYELLPSGTWTNDHECNYLSIVHASLAHSTETIYGHYDFIRFSKLQVRLEAYKRIVHLIEFMIQTLDDDFDSLYVYDSGPSMRYRARPLLEGFLSRALAMFRTVYRIKRVDSSWQPLGQFTTRDLDVHQCEEVIRGFLHNYDWWNKNNEHELNSTKPLELNQIKPASNQYRSPSSNYKFIFENPGLDYDDPPIVDDDTGLSEEEGQECDSNYDSWTTDREDEDDDQGKVRVESDHDAMQTHSCDDETERNERFYDANGTHSSCHDNKDVACTVQSDAHNSAEDATNGSNEDMHSVISNVDTQSSRDKSTYESYIVRSNAIDPSKTVVLSNAQKQDLDQQSNNHDAAAKPRHADAQDRSEIGRALFIDGPIPSLFTTNASTNHGDNKNEENEDMTTDSPDDSDEDFIMIATGATPTSTSDDEETSSYHILSPVSPLFSGSDTEGELI